MEFLLVCKFICCFQENQQIIITSQNKNQLTFSQKFYHKYGLLKHSSAFSTSLQELSAFFELSLVSVIELSGAYKDCSHIKCLIYLKWLHIFLLILSLKLYYIYFITFYLFHHILLDLLSIFLYLEALYLNNIAHYLDNQSMENLLINQVGFLLPYSNTIYTRL